MLRAWVVSVVGVVVCNCGGTDEQPVDAGGDAVPDVAIDADEGSGFRVAGTAIGIRDPMTIELQLDGATAQTILVTEDGPFRFPRRLADGTAYALVAGGGQTCTGLAAGTIAGADTALDVTCDGVIDLLAFTSTVALRISPRFDPRVTDYVALQPLVLDATDTMTVATTAMYAAPTAVAIAPSATVPLDTPQTITLSRAGFADRVYTLDLERDLLREAYAKASDPKASGFLGGVGQLAGSEGIEKVKGVGSPLALGGNGVAIAGDTLAAGASGANAVYVFARTGVVWTLQQKLAAPVSGATFGVAVAVDGDNLVVGAPHDLPGGAAYVYHRTNGVWMQQGGALRAAVDTNALFGAAVAIAGTHLVVGAPNQSDPNGAAFVFRDAGGAWVQDQALTTTAGGRLGAAVAISATDVAAGAPFEASDVGAVYVCPQLVCTSPVRIASGVLGRFGFSVALDGALLVVGSPRESNFDGRARVYLRSGTTVWTLKTTLQAAGNSDFGFAVSAERGHVVIGAPNEVNGSLPSSGAVYLARCDAAGICALDTRRPRSPASTPGTFDRFGKSVSIRGDSFAAGAPFEDSSAAGIGGNENDNSLADSGAVYVFR